jgi:hypothetical protein
VTGGAVLDRKRLAKLCFGSDHDRERASVAAAQHPPPASARLAQLQWSNQQLDAIEAIETWLGKGNGQVFYLAGYAGVGKTTVLKCIASIAGDNVLFAAYTGRAAAVMTRKGCIGATTIDRLIYSRPFVWTCAQCGTPPCAALCRHARQVWQPRELKPDSEVAAADLVIVDEVSMVNEEMARDLMSLTRRLLSSAIQVSCRQSRGRDTSPTANPTFSCTRSTARRPTTRSSRSPRWRARAACRRSAAMATAR